MECHWKASVDVHDGLQSVSGCSRPPPIGTIPDVARERSNENSGLPSIGLEDGTVDCRVLGLL